MDRPLLGLPLPLPVAPPVAGAMRLGLPSFLLYSAIGALLWAVGLTVLGYLIGNVPAIKDNLDIAIIVIVLISVAPIAIHRLHARRNRA